MLAPVATLGILVEASVAIAGFSGVVVVFGRREAQTWPPIDRGRFRVLLSTRFGVLFLSLVTLVLLHAGVGSATTWRIGSMLLALIAIHEVTSHFRRVSHVPSDEPQRPNTAILVILIGRTLTAFVLNLGNAFVLGEFWAFLAGQVWLFGLACYSFAQLLLGQGRVE